MDYVDFLHGGNIYEVERTYGRKLLDFSANINPLGIPSQIKETIYKSFGSILHYPDPEAQNVTREIAQYWGIKEENVLVGNGSVELIYLIMSAFKPKVTFIPVPTFSEYERAARCVKSKIRFIRLKEKNNFTLKNFEAVRKADSLFLCNPNNPTGNLICGSKRAIDKLPAKLLIIDEVFMDFLPDEKKHTLIWEAQKDKRIVVLRTFTKFFALAGLRLGYLVAHQDIVKKLRRYQTPWSANAFAQLAGEMILKDREFIQKTRRLIEKERRFLFNGLSRIKQLTPLPSAANFLLVKIDDENISSSLLKRRLIQRGILIRDCANFRGLNNKFIRIAVRSHNENLKLVRALQELL